MSCKYRHYEELQWLLFVLIWYITRVSACQIQFCLIWAVFLSPMIYLLVLFQMSKTYPLQSQFCNWTKWKRKTVWVKQLTFWLFENCFALFRERLSLLKSGREKSQQVTREVTNLDLITKYGIGHRIVYMCNICTPFCSNLQWFFEIIFTETIPGFSFVKFYPMSWF